MGELPEHTELLVVGGGPGGYAAAFRAADLGREVTMISDEERLGGVCLLRGCIPSKALLEVAELVERTREAKRQGVRFRDLSIDVAALRGWSDGIVDKLSDGLAAIAHRRGVNVVHGRATFASSSEVHLSDGDFAGSLDFDHAIVATGSEPVALPGTDFGGRIMDSAAALGVPDVPERLLVVGGGYVGLELATVYSALGSRVTVAEATDRLIAMVDDDLTHPLRGHLDRRLAGVHLRTAVAELAASDEGVRAVLEGGAGAREERYDRALVAIGRRPRTAALGLEHTDVELDEHGYVVVDERRRSADPTIWAVGDAAGGAQLAHEAMAEGRVAAEAIAGLATAFDARAVPAVIYTDPQVAWCGLTEREAKARGWEVDVARFPWRASGRALTLGAADGLTKLMTEPGTGRVLGVGIVGRGAESLIAEGVLAVEMGAVVGDLALAIAPHPTLSETIHQAAEVQLGSPVDLPPQRAARG